MEFCDKESLLLFSLSSSRCLWAIDLIVTTIICRQWFQLKWFLAMIWPWLLFDYYHPKSSKSRFAQCFQWFSRNSAKQDVFGKNRTTLENTAFYPLMPENSDSVGRTFESCRAYHKNIHPNRGGHFYCPIRFEVYAPEGQIVSGVPKCREIVWFHGIFI